MNTAAQPLWKAACMPIFSAAQIQDAMQLLFVYYPDAAESNATKKSYKYIENDPPCL